MTTSINPNSTRSLSKLRRDVRGQPREPCNGCLPGRADSQRFPRAAEASQPRMLRAARRDASQRPHALHARSRSITHAAHARRCLRGHALDRSTCPGRAEIQRQRISGFGCYP
ncbi:hypothetical protein R5R35_006218 [Gryllus longicercus]|uniref:Uncharacterized protein n=1 Tax=Gryllus longicercus TaxID=2509291 RepID=A0AAN9WEQ8_9ORTH